MPYPRIITSNATAAAIVAMALAGCGQRERPPTPAPAPVRAAAPGAAPPTTPAAGYTLILTWLAVGEPPSTSQTSFHDAASCERARDAALAEGQRLAADAAAAFAAATAKFAATEHHYVGATALGDTEPAPVLAAVPKVTAICAGG